MTVYALLNNQKTVSGALGTAQVDANGVALPAGSNLPQGSVVASPLGGAGMPVGGPINQAFHVVVTGTGSVSATVQTIASNDGVNWFNYGTAITVASGASPQQGNSVSPQSPFAYYSAIVTAITGTNAAVKCLMAA